MPEPDPPVAPVPSHVVELRTHGVSGTPPESILRWDHVIQVAGDARSRFHRRATPDGVEVEAEPVAGVRRLLESYHWGEMTSGGLGKAAWSLLLPFAMTNLAQWMLPARGTREQASGPPVSPLAKNVRAWLRNVARALVRLVSLGLTMLFAVQTAVIALDLVASQCLAEHEACFDGVSALRILRRNPDVRAGLAAGVVVLVLAAVWWLSRDTLARTYRGDAPPEARYDRSTPWITSPSFVRTSGESGSLRALHGVGAFAAATLVLAGGAAPLPGRWNHVAWWVAVVLVLLAAVVVLLLDDPSGGAGGSKLIRRFFGRPVLELAWPVAVAALFVVVASVDGGRTITTGQRELRAAENFALDWLMPALAAWCALLLVVALLLLPFTRAGRRAMPREFRPWLAGTLAPFTAALAALVAGGLGTAATVFADNCLTNNCRPRSFGSSGTDPFFLPRIYAAVDLLWGLAGVVAVVAGVVAVAVAAARTWDDTAVPERVQGRAERRPWFIARLKFGAQYALGGVVIAAVLSGAVAFVVADPRAWLNHGWHVPASIADDRWIKLLEALGVFGLVAAIVWLVGAIRKAAKNPDQARNLGVIWDVASFWPAEAHPFVPSGYAQRALPDLQERVEAHLADPGTRVVLCGHSQGSMIVYAVAWRLVRDHRGTDDGTLDRFGLITHGSQLRWIFPRVFPGMLDFTDHVQLMTELGGRWHNVTRFTDPVGGPVLSWRLTTAGVAAPRIRGDALTAVDGVGTVENVDAVVCSGDDCVGVQVVGREHWLPDPVRPEPGPVDQVAPIGHAKELSGALHEHSDHPNDPHWPHVVAAAAGLR